jgi:AcrR family transcriptional regulator
VATGGPLEKPHTYARRTKAERQREIAEATLKLVAKYGVHGTTVSRIAAAVGLSRGALYKHFPSRQAVLLAAMDLMEERPTGWVAQSSGPDVYERLLDMGDRHASWASSEFETFIHPLFEFIAAGGQGSLSREMGVRQLRVLDAFVDLVEAGKREGSIRPEVDSCDVAWSLLMFAWAEDVARLMGVDQLITSGASTRIFRRMLADVAAPPSGDPEAGS